MKRSEKYPCWRKSGYVKAHYQFALASAASIKMGPWYFWVKLYLMLQTFYPLLQAHETEAKNNNLQGWGALCTFSSRIHSRIPWRGDAPTNAMNLPFSHERLKKSKRFSFHVELVALICFCFLSPCHCSFLQVLFAISNTCCVLFCRLIKKTVVCSWYKRCTSTIGDMLLQKWFAHTRCGIFQKKSLNDANLFEIPSVLLTAVMLYVEMKVVLERYFCKWSPGETRISCEFEQIKPVMRKYEYEESRRSLWCRLHFFHILFNYNFQL